LAEFFNEISPEHKAFIEAQHLFFVATAPTDPDSGFPNLSPKGRNLLRVLGPNLVGYVDYPGSGNETATHLDQNGKITVMLCSFEATAGIMRIYGRGRHVDLDDPDLRKYRNFFVDDLHPYIRQAFFIEVEKLQTSCGYAVPRLDYRSERDTLDKYCERKLEPREYVDGIPVKGQLVAKR
jgi:hypothetical protein